MKNTLIAVAALAGLSLSVSAQTVSGEAAESAAAATPASPLSANLALVSDYRFRGLSQSFRRPALQGGFDYAHPSGFYVGNWNSSVSGNQYNNGAGLEMDFYGGYKFEPVKDVSADVGLLYYAYPGASIGSSGQKYNNGELYFSFGYRWFSAKYSYGLTDFFGLNTRSGGANGGSKGSGYLDLNANFAIAEKTTLTLHAGHQAVRHYGQLDYADYKLGVARDLGFATLGLALVGTNADRALYTVTDGAGHSKDIGGTTAVLSLSKTF
ncbi:MAG TPA: TorF family putative porin [Burkholderiaceae bacterium]|nr:TorF family putative porin [Burkholderiaceae bacterium]